MSTMAVLENVRTNLRREMQRQGLSQQDLSERTGLHYVTISRILTGKIEPSIESCELLARAVGMPPEMIFQNFGKSAE